MNKFIIVNDNKVIGLCNDKEGLTSGKSSIENSIPSNNKVYKSSDILNVMYEKGGKNEEFNSLIDKVNSNTVTYDDIKNYICDCDNVIDRIH